MMSANILKKKSLPSAPPKEFKDIIIKLKEIKNKEECLREAYSFMSGTYRGYKIKTFTRFFEILNFESNKLFNKKDFHHCTKLNYLMRYLLIEGGCFHEDDITQKWTTINYISLHQYLVIRISENKFVNIDIWGNAYGIKFGEYAHGFNTTLAGRDSHE